MHGRPRHDRAQAANLDQCRLGGERRKGFGVSTYLFDPTWQRERDRLGALEALFDGSSKRLLAALDLREGMRCLEVGCGAGGIARWLADQVGGIGHVLATDLDTRFVDGEGRANLDVLTHDVVTDGLADGAFDLIHARAVLEHIPARDDVLRTLGPGEQIFEPAHQGHRRLLQKVRGGSIAGRGRPGEPLAEPARPRRADQRVIETVPVWLSERMP